MTGEDDEGAEASGVHEQDCLAPRRRHRRVVRQGTETQAVSGVSADERSSGWSEGGAADAACESANDERLKRDVPPHW
jgi:hypothetical protein